MVRELSRAIRDTIDKSETTCEGRGERDGEPIFSEDNSSGGQASFGRHGVNLVAQYLLYIKH